LPFSLLFTVWIRDSLRGGIARARSGLRAGWGLGPWIEQGLRYHNKALLQQPLTTLLLAWLPTATGLQSYPSVCTWQW